MSESVSGNGNYIKSSPGITNDFTICSWTTCTTLPSAVEFQSAVGIDDNAGFNGWGFDGDGFLAAFCHAFAGGYAQLVTAVANTPYFVAMTFGPGNGDVFAFWGTGGALTKVAVCTGTFANANGDLIIFNETADDQALKGTVVAFKMWNAILTDAQIANEYRSLAPRRTGSIYSFQPLLRAGYDGLDWSGQGHPLTKTGTLSSAAINAPCPWKPQAMMMGG